MGRCQDRHGQAHHLQWTMVRRRQHLQPTRCQATQKKLSSIHQQFAKMAIKCLGCTKGRHRVALWKSPHTQELTAYPVWCNREHGRSRMAAVTIHPPMLHYRPWRATYAAVPGARARRRDAAHAPGSGAVVPGYYATEGDHHDEGQRAGASTLSLLSRRREKIPCDTGIIRERC